MLTLSVYAATVELNANHPDTYTVRKGDTLWSISARFLKQPWLWPEVWQANPQIKNPHLIYPGDEISLAYVNGRPRLMVNASHEEGFGPHVRATPLEDAIKPIPLERIQDFLKKPRWVGEEDIKTLPHVLAMEDDHIRGTPGQLIYVRNLNAPVGTTFAVVRPLGRYYEIAYKDGGGTEVFRQTMRDRDDRPSQLWHRGPDLYTLKGDVHFLGYEMEQFATVQVTHEGNPASTLALSADYEIRQGDYLLPMTDAPFDFQYVPHAPAQLPPNMHVIALSDSIANAGRFQVIALSRGARDGVENGQTYAIFHEGSKVRDYNDYPGESATTFFHHDESKVQLPEEYIGHVMVFRTFDAISYGLIMDGIRPVHIGDRLYEPDHR
ncbi:MAG TPA: LysM peptidoglycan-binding domain-containing protein [Rudaea sp.]